MRMALAFQRAGTHLPLFSLSLCRRKKTEFEKEHICCARDGDFLFGFCTVSEQKAVAQEVVQKVQACRSLARPALHNSTREKAHRFGPKRHFSPVASLETFCPCVTLSLLGEAKPTLPRLMFCETQSHPIALGS